MNSVEDALNKPEVIIDRWILRLGKDSEEAGKFSPWFLPSNTLEQDFAGFIVCLNLLKLVDAVKDRMSTQKKEMHAVKKQQRAEAKEIAKMKAKVEKAAAKAQLKLDRAAEKERIKQDAKAAREAAKLDKHTQRSVLVAEAPTPSPEVLPVCPSIWNVTPGSPKDTVQFVGKESGGVFEEGMVERKPFVIPEEG